MNNKDIVISIAADSRKFLQEMQSALAAAEKQAQKSGITDALEQKFKKLNILVGKSHRQITALLSDVSNAKLDDSALDSMTGKLKNTLKLIHNMLQDASGYSLDFDFSTGDSLDTFITQVINSLRRFSGQTSGLHKTVQTIQTSLNSLGDDSAVTDASSLWVEIGTKIDSLFNSGQKIDKRTKIYKKAIQEILDLYKTYTSLGGSASLSVLANTTASAGIDPSAASALEKAYEKQNSAKILADSLKESAGDAQNAATSLENASSSSAKASSQAAGSLNNQADAMDKVKNSADNLASGIHDAENAAAELSDINVSASDSADESAKDLNNEADAITEIAQAVQESQKSIGILKSMSDMLAEGIGTMFDFVLKPFSLELKNEKRFRQAVWIHIPITWNQQLIRILFHKCEKTAPFILHPNRIEISLSELLQF